MIFLNTFHSLAKLSKKIWNKINEERLNRIKECLLFANSIILTANEEIKYSLDVSKSGGFCLLSDKLCGKDDRSYEDFSLFYNLGTMGTFIRDANGNEVETEAYFCRIGMDGLYFFPVSQRGKEYIKDYEPLCYENISDEVKNEFVFLPSGNYSLPVDEFNDVYVPEQTAREWLSRLDSSYLLNEISYRNENPYDESVLLTGGDRFTFELSCLCADAASSVLKTGGIVGIDKILYSVYLTLFKFESVASGMAAFILESGAGKFLLQNVLYSKDMESLMNAINSTFDRIPNDRRKKNRNEINVPLSYNEFSLFIQPFPTLVSNMLEGKISSEKSSDTRIVSSTPDQIKFNRMKKHMENILKREGSPEIASTLKNMEWSVDGDVGKTLTKLLNKIDSVKNTKSISSLNTERRKYYSTGMERFSPVAVSTLFESGRNKYSVDEKELKVLEVSTLMQKEEFASRLKTLALSPRRMKVSRERLF